MLVRSGGFEFQPKPLDYHQPNCDSNLTLKDRFDIPFCFAIAFLSSSEVGLGYLFSIPLFIIESTTGFIFGVGGYGFSLVLSLMSFLPSRGCSPGT